MWEFPGANIKIFTALKREINEELDCTIDIYQTFNEHTHEYETFFINLISVKYTIIAGTPKPMIILNRLAKSIIISVDSCEYTCQLKSNKRKMVFSR